MYIRDCVYWMWECVKRMSFRGVLKGSSKGVPPWHPFWLTQTYFHPHNHTSGVLISSAIYQKRKEKKNRNRQTETKSKKRLSVRKKELKFMQTCVLFILVSILSYVQSSHWPYTVAISFVQNILLWSKIK